MNLDQILPLISSFSGAALAKLGGTVQNSLTALEANPFASGGLVLMAVGAVGAYLRSWPRSAWQWLRSRFLIEVEIKKGHGPAFQWIEHYLANSAYCQKRARRLILETIYEDEEEGEPGEPAKCKPEAAVLAPAKEKAGNTHLLLTPAPGAHRLRFQGRFFSVSRIREEKEQHTNEYFQISTFSRSRNPIYDLIREAHRCADPTREQRIQIYSARYEDWRLESRARPRPPESVVLRAGLLEEITDKIQRFQQERDWYFDRGIPHRLGILLHGSPGSGKTSAVAAVASALNLNVAILSLASPDLNDDRLRTLIADLPKRTILLIEDIDCVTSGRVVNVAIRSRDDDGDSGSGGVSFSGLLNALDGIAAGDGRITFMTTNHIGKLDPALIRPGRVDLKCLVCRPDSDQAQRLFLRFFPGSPRRSEFLAALGDPAATSMAALQGHLIKYSRDDLSAVSNAAELREPEYAIAA